MGAEASNIQYTTEVPNSSKPGQSSVYLHPEAKPYLSTSLSSHSTTVYEILQRSANIYSTCPFLGTRQDSTYSWKSYKEVFDISSTLGLFFVSLGIQNNTNIGIYSKNREEWIITDIACITQGIVSVPLYEMLQENDLQAIVEETELELIACSQSLLKRLFMFKKNTRLASLKYLLVFDDVSEENIQEAGELGLQLYEYKKVVQEKFDGEPKPLGREGVFTICYTSGTTGRRKGAVISNNNIVSAIAGVVNQKVSIDSNDSHLSYLPLAHMMERIFVYLMAEAGGSIGFYSGDTSKIKEDLCVLKPTIFISVPRLFNRFYELIIREFNAATGINRVLISKALSAKMGNYHNYQQVQSTIWDKLALSGVRNTLGGRIRLMATGSAPITGEVLTFLRIVFSCPIIEGYGQTESCAASFLTLPNDLDCGNIGGPVCNLETKLIDVPEMRYFSTDVDITGNPQPRGELCIRGPAVFSGYYKNDEATQEALDGEGWLHTGDIAIRLNHNGAFKIIDRKKNFFKLAQGEYVATEKVESVFVESEFISQIFVYGDSFQSYLIAVIVPDEGFVRENWGRDKEIDGVGFDEICLRDDLKRDILEDMKVRGIEAGLYGYEHVRKIHLECRTWTDRDFLTPTYKLIRFKLKMNYQGVIAELYSEPLND